MKTSRKTIWWIAIPTAIAVCLWLLIFEIPALFTPLRNRPEEIVVYRYGQTRTYTKDNEEFSEIYRLLREEGNGTVTRWLSGDEILGANRWGWMEEMAETYQNHGIIVYLNYKNIQKGRLPGANGAAYDQVVFVLFGKHSSDEAKDVWGYTAAFYTNTQQQPKHYAGFANYRYPKKAEEYIDSLEIN